MLQSIALQELFQENIPWRIELIIQTTYKIYE